MGFYGTPRWYIDGVAIVKANSTLAITASQTRYVSINRALTTFTEIASAFAPDKLALYKTVTSGSAITSYEDHRDLHHYNRFQYSRIVIAMADADKTLTYEQAMCESLEFTGANTAVRVVTVPAVPRAWTVYANTTTNGVLVATAGSPTEGVTIAVGKTAIVECDGTRVRRITADNP
jgi:hypothetical protein